MYVWLLVQISVFGVMLITLALTELESAFALLAQARGDDTLLAYLVAGLIIWIVATLEAWRQCGIHDRELAQNS
ncbi:hypothetical protein P5704_026745 (plasmid) [Pseudomonas sp. FeN3W]|nr:hypothetical protein P5704_026745 [Pseudomonas sp. FeN3W]